MPVLRYMLGERSVKIRMPVVKSPDVENYITQQHRDGFHDLV
jgi:hypothetical protein